MKKESKWDRQRRRVVLPLLLLSLVPQLTLILLYMIGGDAGRHSGVSEHIHGDTHPADGSDLFFRSSLFTQRLVARVPPV